MASIRCNGTSDKHICMLELTLLFFHSGRDGSSLAALNIEQIEDLQSSILHNFNFKSWDCAFQIYIWEEEEIT